MKTKRRRRWAGFAKRQTLKKWMFDLINCWIRHKADVTPGLDEQPPQTQNISVIWKGSLKFYQLWMGRKSELTSDVEEQPTRRQKFRFKLPALANHNSFLWRAMWSPNAFVTRVQREMLSMSLFCYFVLRFHQCGLGRVCNVKSAEHEIEVDS